MKRYCWTLLILILTVLPKANAQQGIIVRDALGATGLNATCLLLNCQVSLNLGDPSGQLFLITVDNSLSLPSFLTLLLNQVGVLDAEVDQQLFLIEATVGPNPRVSLGRDAGSLLWRARLGWICESAGSGNRPATPSSSQLWRHRRRNSRDDRYRG